MEIHLLLAEIQQVKLLKVKLTREIYITFSCVPFQRERDDFRLQIKYRKFARQRDHCRHKMRGPLPPTKVYRIHNLLLYYRVYRMWSLLRTEVLSFSTKDIAGKKSFLHPLIPSWCRSCYLKRQWSNNLALPLNHHHY